MKNWELMSVAYWKGCHIEVSLTDDSCWLRRYYVVSDQVCKVLL